MILLLIRHGDTDWVGRGLAGRQPGVRLNERGRAQAAALAGQLPELDALYSSPQPRAVETAEPIARRQSLRIRPRAEFDEIDFGAWTGRGFARLEGDPEWGRWNRARSRAQPPGGESIAQVFARVAAGIAELRRRVPPGRAVGLVSHGEVLRTAALLALRRPPEDWPLVPWEPAQVRVLRVGPRVWRLWPRPLSPA